MLRRAPNRSTGPRSFFVSLAVLVYLQSDPAAAQLVCVGDCDSDGRVSIAELIRGVNIALGTLPLAECPSFDRDGNGVVVIGELIKAVNNALTGCDTVATAAIGPEGGSLVSLDGLLRIDIPPGALAATTTLSISAAAAAAPPGGIGPAFDIGPPGLSFAVPALITLFYDAAALGGAETAKLRVARATDDAWEALGDTVIDEEAQSVSGTTSGLSVFGLVELGVGLGCPAPLSQDCAIARLIDAGWLEEANELLSNVHRWNAPLELGKVLDEGLVTSAEEIEIAEESWLFFVDREPGAAFLHPTVFVLVGRDTETLQEYGRDAPPRVDGITLFATPEERENARLRIAGFPYFDFSERSATTSTLPTGVTLGAGVDIPDPIPVDNLRPSPAELDDLLGLYNPDRNETAEAFERRVEGYFERLQPEEIVDAELEKCRCAGATSNKLALLIDGGGFEEGESAPLAAHLRGQGFEVQYLAPDQPDTPGAENARTTIPAIDQAFENLAAQIEDCCDEILVILNGHGSPDGFFLANPQLTINVLDNQGEPTGETKIVGDVNGGFLFTAALKAHLNTLRSCRTTVLIDSCFSGTHLEGGLNSITAEDAPGCLCRTVMVSSSARQFSFGGALGELTETLTSGGSLADAYRAMRDKMSPPVRDDRRHRQTPQVQSTACTLCEDADGDGIVTGEELADGFSDPTNPDTDGDGLLDGAEKTERTDPRNPDSDDDGLTDGEEVLTHGTDPLDRDSDDDGLTDQNEIFLTTDPLDPDTDMGGVNDGEEVLRGTNPLDPSDDDPPPATATEAPTFTATTAPTQTPTATHTPTASFTNTPTPTASLTPTDTAAVVSGPITAKLLGDTPLGSQNKPVMSVAAPVIDPQGFVDVVTFAGTDTFDLSVLVARLDDIPNGDNLIAPARQGAAPPVEVLVEEGETVPNSTAVIGGIRDLNAGTDGEFALLATDQGNSIVRLVSGGPVVPVLGVGAPGARADFDPSKYVVGGGDVVAVAVDGEGNTAIVTADLADPAITVPILATGDSFGGGTVTEVFALDPIFANASNRGTARIEIDDGPDVIISYDTNSGGPTAVLTEGEAAPGFAPGVNILRFTSSARINDAGFIAVLARVFGTGISNANDEVVYVLDSDGQLAGRVQEGTQVPGAAPGTVITLPSAPIMGPTGAFFLHRQVAADMSSPRGVGFVDLGGSFRTIALAGTAAPGGGVFDEFTNAYAMNADGLLVFRARLEDNSSAYYLVDTSDAESEPVRLIGPGDVTSLPQGGTATIASVGTIPDTGGQSGDPNALNQTQLTLSARLDTDQAAVLVVDLP